MSNFCKILIVDDEYLLRQGLRYLCNWEQEGFTIVGEASSGEEAITLVKELNPNIVITDIVMSEMDGIELTRQIRSYNPSIEIVVLSSYSDFDYVKQAFKYGVDDYILKPKLQPDELLQILRSIKKTCLNLNLPSAKPSLQDSLSKTLKTLINGFICDQVQLDHMHEFFNGSEFFLLLTDISPYYSSNTQEYLKENIFPPQLMKQYMGGCKHSNCIPIQNIYAVLININYNQISHLDLKIKALTNHQHKKFNKLRFAISPSFTALDHLKAIFEDTKTLLSYQFFLENKVLIRPDLIVEETKSSPFDFDFFYSLVESLDVDKVNDYLITYINLVTENLSTNVFSLKKLIENLIYNSINLLKKLKFNMSSFDILKLKYLKSIEDTTSVSLLTEIITDIFNEIFDEINLQADIKNIVIVQKVLHYIEQNYQEQIYLSTIAEKLHLNYHYLSSYFNNHAKESFPDCLNRIRISKAKEFLEDPAISISEVSELVGYSDQSYFGKVFKKYTGSSPSSYRKKYFMI